MLKTNNKQNTYIKVVVFSDSLDLNGLSPELITPQTNKARTKKSVMRKIKKILWSIGKNKINRAKKINVIMLFLFSVVRSLGAILFLLPSESEKEVFYKESVLFSILKKLIFLISQIM